LRVDSIAQLEAADAGARRVAWQHGVISHVNGVALALALALELRAGAPARYTARAGRPRPGGAR